MARVEPAQVTDIEDQRFNPSVDDLAARLPSKAQITLHRNDIVSDLISGSPVDALLNDLARFSNDPEGFVKWAFPWGEPGTPLEDWAGPEQWQRDQQRRIGAALTLGGREGCVIEEDISSGHGIGKSAEVSWMILWAISTFEDTRGVVTANTDLQLRTKTWAELAKWYGLFIARQFFTLTATALYVAGDPIREKSWRIDQIPWSKERSEAFAGMHNQGKRILVVFDEASNIHDNIWTVTEGALTDTKTQILWLRYGNPTRTTGEFFKRCTQGKRNVYARVDSRTVTFTNKKQIQAWVDEYGEDSDFVRVRVKGMFPRAGFDNFISPGLVTEARRRRLNPDVYRSHQKILSCDPARFGDDSTVISLRQGLKLHWQLELKGFDGNDVAARLVEIIRLGGVMDARGKADKGANVPGGAITCLVYDAVGNGAELDGALRRIQGLNLQLIPVHWGQPAKDADQYFNQRAEAWGKMRDWLEHAAVLDMDDLQEQLTSLSYGYDGRMRIQLESKKDAKKRGVASPDRADSLALTFIPELIDRKITIAKVRPVQQRRVVWSR